MRSSTQAISDRAQLRALASPARQELLDLLVRSGPASAATLARLAGRRADGLYYHLRELQRVGLVRPAGSRVEAGRTAALFRATHREPSLNHEPGAHGNSRAVSAIVAAMLRLGARDFRKAAERPSVRTQGPRRELWALRVTGWLSAAELAQVNRQVHALRTTVGRPRPRGKLYAVTVLLAPLDHRARKKQRRPRGKTS
jgi:DNA-binding transcriptional ArsR family regulator